MTLDAFPPEPPSTVRRRLKRIFLSLLLLAGLSLLALNLFLNTPLGPRAFSRHPERFRIAWASAWSFLPGRVHLRGVQVIGHTRNVAWTVTAERARGRIDLPALFSRTFRVTELHAEGVRSQVLRGLRVGAPPRPGQRYRRRPWTLRFERVAIDRVREIRFNDFRLTGVGRAEGAFRTVFGGDFELEPSRLRMPAAQLAMGDEPIGRKIDLQAEASMGPYVVRQHPGLASFDFLTGSLHARGQVPDLPFLERTKISRARPGTLTADLRVDRGRLTIGSRFDITGPAAAAETPFAMTVAVAPVPGGVVLRLGIEAKGMSAGRRPAGPPVFRSRTLSVASATSETRLSRIFATARSLRTRTLPTATLPLIGDVRAEGVEIAAPGSHAFLHATLDRAAGRVNLAGLLAREIVIDGLQADGVSARLDLAQKPPAAAGTSVPWSMRIAGARLSEIRELGLGEFLLSGAARAEATFSYARDGTFAVEHAAIVIPSGRFRVNGEPAVQDLAVDLETRIEPSVLGKIRGPEFLRLVSGTGSIRGGISSLGFLHPYLQKTPWLAIQGQGRLSAGVQLAHGRLAPGSRLTVSAAPVRATIFDSLATGRGIVDITVEQGKNDQRTAMRVRFEQFGLADLRRKGRPAYIRGRGLQITALTPTALDLTAAVPDFDISVELPDAEVPDLTIYNALIPEETGLSIISGQGRVRMHLEASTATRRAKGSATLSSKTGKIQFQNLELQGNLTLRAPLVSPDLASRRFDLKGTRLALDGVSYHDIEGEAPAEPAPWWMRAQLDRGSLIWGAPLSLRGEGRIDMKNSGPLLTVFAQRSRFLRWFDDALNVENVAARGVLRLGNGEVEVESFQATGGSLEVRTRMIFSKVRRRGDLYVRYGRLAAGIELRDGQRSFKLRRPLEWFESRRGLWP
ncbi:MAG TPA: hypothetical protein VGX68_24445 [Thermoanaerobaculia bacterium]|jgi:hypothetical protein|nr:hypothetical protein [Thermoanaerobaculia bacterium]